MPRFHAATKAARHDRVTITVKDEVPGIPEYALDRIFERFYSLGRPDTGKKSTGLGLNFVRLRNLTAGRSKCQSS